MASIRVQDKAGNNKRMFDIDANGLPLATLLAFYPNAIGLSYDAGDGFFASVKMQDGHFVAGKGGWGDRVYSVDVRHDAQGGGADREDRYVTKDELAAQMSRLSHGPLMMSEIIESGSLPYRKAYDKWCPKVPEKDIWFAPAEQDLDFTTNPPMPVGTLEKPAQDWFVACVVPQVEKPWMKIADTRGKGYLLGKKPDISTHAPMLAIGSAAVNRIGEIKRPLETADFAPDEKGQTITYGIAVLLCQPTRDEVTVFLTDCLRVTFFSITREGPSFTVRQSNKFNLTGPASSMGRRLLSAVLSAEDPNIPYSPFSENATNSGVQHINVHDIVGKQRIATTTWSTVWATNNSNFVMKVCAKAEHAAAEICALQQLEIKLCQRYDSLGIIRLHAYSGNAMLLGPVASGSASRVVQAHELPLSVLAPVIDAFEAIHSAGILHRDGRPSNILLVASAESPHEFKPILADFGASCKIDAPPPATLVPCAPSCFWSESLMRLDPFRKEDDLHIFVRGLYSLRYRIPPLATEDQHRQLWTSVGSPWKEMLNMCEQLDYKGLKTAVAGLA